MISVAEADRLLAENAPLFPSETITLDRANGRTLLQDIYCDRDFPAFNRVAMDGICIDSGSYIQGQREFSIQGIQAAGSLQEKLSSTAQCLEVMTGAVLPDGADCVVRVEDLEFIDGRRRVRLADALLLRPFTNVHTQASDRHKGDLLLSAGTRLSSAEIAAAATVGAWSLMVAALPKAAIVYTGDELVEVEQEPKSHQIRVSNAWFLDSAFSQRGWSTVSRVHLKDEREGMSAELKQILESHDTVILSGGVSMGSFDFVPQVLEELGVVKIFHRIAQKPGKPFWFGQYQNRCCVYALPGNPVSVALCWIRYTLPHLYRRMQARVIPSVLPLANPELLEQLCHPILTCFVPAQINSLQGRDALFPITTGGSGDLAALIGSQGMLELPSEDHSGEETRSLKLYRWNLGIE